MGKIFRENWFKIVVAVAVLIVAISVGYYFVVAPKEQGQKNNADSQSACKIQVQQYISESLEGEDITDQIAHYNQKLNKCFLLESSKSSDTVYLEALIDVSDKSIQGILAECSISYANGDANYDCSVSTDDPVLWDMRFVSYKEYLDYVDNKMELSQ
jgi:hypothetical protein